MKRDLGIPGSDTDGNSAQRMAKGRADETFGDACVAVDKLSDVGDVIVELVVTATAMMGLCFAEHGAS